MPNTRQFDRMIQTASRKLQGVRNSEISALSASEQARVFALVGRGAAKVVRSKSPSKTDRAIDRIFEGAVVRYTAEIRAAEQAKAQVVADAAAAKVAKRSAGWW
ncbi:hypothetical protein ACFWR9_40875 [Streptomyces sp. NPDC058534]|uniref:hypothetical protein n=1 Tax=Streptomyces sp. NPDC058534 TaxID=3346541 RepID=UPI00364A6A5C